MSSIGEKIKTARLKRGLKQKDFATRLKVTSQAVSGWERGISFPNVELYDKIADILGVPKDIIFFKKDKIAYNTDIIAYVPFMPDIAASAGNGFTNQFSEETYYPLPKNVYNTQNNKQNIVCIRTIGDSMEPIIRSGSILAINQSTTEIQDGGLYVICMHDALRVKELSISANGVVIRSYNEAYKKECISLTYFNKHIRILGKVFWFSSVLN
ncbi:helix-turn-helix transcriptional regulator [Vibrio sp. S11_S32]|uniref:XRE family transcriptional regulator n=1 Tax=Vibrio sp. S11_S32 TaxID=2720225 RepID=UPI001680B81F|nr:XRE family transcriptional regulator [Vibrio sp. S11_S32]MBD1576942.1 helix-turn-helix transcriptional regulator [Vibrio sp. S11_S32]